MVKRLKKVRKPEKRLCSSAEISIYGQASTIHFFSHLCVKVGLSKQRMSLTGRKAREGKQ